MEPTLKTEVVCPLPDVDEDASMRITIYPNGSMEPFDKSDARFLEDEFVESIRAGETVTDTSLFPLWKQVTRQTSQKKFKNEVLIALLDYWREKAS